MYALQYGELLYFTESEKRLFSREPDAALEINDVPEYKAGYIPRIDAQNKKIVFIKINDLNHKEPTNSLKDAINQIWLTL